jgi:hypothetical protein
MFQLFTYDSNETLYDKVKRFAIIFVLGFAVYIFGLGWRLMNSHEDYLDKKDAEAIEAAMKPKGEISDHGQQSLS